MITHLPTQRLQVDVQRGLNLGVSEPKLPVFPQHLLLPQPFPPQSLATPSFQLLRSEIWHHSWLFPFSLTIQFIRKSCWLHFQSIPRISLLTTFTTHHSGPSLDHTSNFLLVSTVPAPSGPAAVFSHRSNKWSSSPFQCETEPDLCIVTCVSLCMALGHSKGRCGLLWMWQGTGL